VAGVADSLSKLRSQLQNVSDLQIKFIIFEAESSSVFGQQDCIGNLSSKRKI